MILLDMQKAKFGFALSNDFTYITILYLITFFESTYYNNEFNKYNVKNVRRQRHKVSGIQGILTLSALQGVNLGQKLATSPYNSR